MTKSCELWFPWRDMVICCYAFLMVLKSFYSRNIFRFKILNYFPVKLSRPLNHAPLATTPTLLSAPCIFRQMWHFRVTSFNALRSFYVVSCHSWWRVMNNLSECLTRITDNKWIYGSNRRWGPLQGERCKWIMLLQWPIRHGNSILRKPFLHFSYPS